MRAVWLVMMAGVAAIGCGGTTQHAQQWVHPTPPTPAMAGTYDFDLLDAVTGTACVESDGHTSYAAALAGARLDGSGLVAQAQAAAVYDALARVKGADVLLVSRSLSQGDPQGRVCATVFGRAIRLKKGPTITPAAPVQAAPAEEPKGGIPLLGK